MFTMNLEGTVVVVTGGSSGIGMATVEKFIKAGASVAFCARDLSRLNAARDDLLRRHPEANLLAMSCDVLKPNEVTAFAEATATKYGGANILVNNAGQGRVSTFESTSDEGWTAELNLKFFSVIHPVRAFLPLLEKAPNAAIVCVNALLAVQPEPHMVATSSARAGVLNMTHSLAMEFAPKNIRVNSVLLGVIESAQWRKRFQKEAQPGQSWENWVAQLAKEKRIPLGRIGTTDEVATAILFLATAMSSYTTGSYIDISGGVARHV